MENLGNRQAAHTIDTRALFGYELPGFTSMVSRKVVQGGLILLLVFAPLAFGSVHPWAIFVMEITTLLLFFSMAASRMWEGVPVLERWPPRWPLLIFLLVPLLQMVPVPASLRDVLSPGLAAIPGFANSSSSWRPLSVYPFATQEGFLRFLTGVMAFFLASQSFREKKELKRLLVTIVLIGSAEAIYGMVVHLSGSHQVLFLRKKYYLDSATGTFINRNHFAGFLEMSIFVTMGGVLSLWPDFSAAWQKNKSWLSSMVFEWISTFEGSAFFLLLLSLSVQILALVMSGSRMGFFSVLGAALTLAVMFGAGGAKKGRILFVMALVLITLSIGVTSSHLVERFASLMDATEPSEGRFLVWAGTARMFLAFPVIGSGFGTFFAIFPFFMPQGLRATYTHAHNEYLQVLAETGLLGFISILLVFVVYSREILKRWRSLGDPVNKGIVVGSSGAIVAMLVHALADFNFRIPANAFLFAIVAGFLLAASRESGGALPTRGLDRKPLDALSA